MKKELFESMFNTYITPHVDSYNGKQPIMSWEYDSKTPKLEPMFMEHLPLAVRSRILEMVESLKDDE